MEDQFDLVYPSHGSIPVEKDMIDKLIAAAEKLMNGELEGHDAEFHGIPLKVYDAGCAKFLSERT